MASYDEPDTIYDDPSTRYNELNLNATTTLMFDASATTGAFGFMVGPTSITFTLTAFPEAVAAALMRFTVTGHLVRSPFGPANPTTGTIYGTGSGTGALIYGTSSGSSGLPYEEGSG